MTEIKNFVIEFDYNLETLNKVKDTALAIDKTNIEEVENTVKQLVKIRRAIEIKGKTYRDEANAFNKMVLSKENEYVKIIEPIEAEFKEILEADKQRQVIEARKELLPMKKQQLSVLKVLSPNDDVIIGMNDEEWIAFYNEKFTEHTRQVENEAKAEQQEKERIEREANIKQEAEERAKIAQAEAFKKAEDDKIKAVENAKKEMELKALKVKQEADLKIQKQQEAEEAKLKAEMESRTKMEADKKYQNWLKENGYTEDKKSDFIVEKVGNKIRLSKIVAFYTI